MLLSMLGHFTVDWYAGILRPLLPLIMANFSLTEGGTALIPAILGTVMSFIQPFGAVLAGKFGEKRLLVASIFLTSVFMSLIGIASSVLMLIVFLVLGRLGNAFFHPVAATFVGKLRFSKEHTAMTTFSIGGTIGAALSPLMVVWYVEHFDMKSLLYLSIFGIVIAVFCAIFIREDIGEKEEKIRMSGNLFSSLKTKGVKELMLIIVLRTASTLSLSTLIVLYLNSLGYRIVWVGYFLTLGTLSGALGNYLGAVMCDRIGPKLVNIASLGIAGGFALLLLASTNLYILLFSYIALSFFSYATMGSNISYIQSMLPHNRGIASSLGMGISWGIASILFTILSTLINSVGLYEIMVISALFLPIGSAMALRLPKKEKILT
ncbi:MAG: MFS transporter [Synergistetes bacterium]|nr:MFS transporter [Synergistota bacterium]